MIFFSLFSFPPPPFILTNEFSNFVFPMQMSYFRFARTPIFRNHHRAITFSSIISSLLLSSSLLSALRHARPNFDRIVPEKIITHTRYNAIFSPLRVIFWEKVWKREKKKIYRGDKLFAKIGLQLFFSFFFSRQSRETDVDGRKCRWERKSTTKLRVRMTRDK